MQNERPEAVIARWTKEDYLSESGEPFRWLYERQQDSYTFNRLKAIMTEAARRAGVKNFAALLKAYGESLMKKSNQVWAEEVTCFPDQALELNSGPYVCNEMGVTTTDAFGSMVTVCPHPIMPVERLVNIDSGEVRIKIAYRRMRSGWRTAVFDKATLSNARAITALSSCGISVTSETAKDLVKYLSYMEDRNYDEIPEVQTVGRLGWVDDFGFSPYVERLIYDTGGQFEEEFKSVRAGGSFEEWLKVARGARASDSMPTRIALAASFASVLVKKFNALPFIVHLWGSVSGIGKSVALIFAASVWAYPEIGHYVKTTKATDVALEQLAFFAGNMPLCLDELQLIQNRKNFDDTVYALCEGVGKARGSKTGGLQTVRRWCNSIITTGEQPIISSNSKAGATNRVLEIECTEKTFPDPRETYQILVHNYGHAGRRFVERLQEDEDALQVAHDAQQRFYDELSGKATDKQVLMASILLAADYMANLFIFEDDNCLTADDILPYLVEKSQTDVNQAAYEYLLDWAGINQNKFVPVGGVYQGECWGCYRTAEKKVPESMEEAAILCITLPKFEAAMTEQGYNPRAFLSWANKNGVLRRQGKDNWKSNVTISGIQRRCVCLWINRMDFEDASDEEIPF